MFGFKENCNIAYVGVLGGSQKSLSILCSKQDENDQIYEFIQRIVM